MKDIEACIFDLDGVIVDTAKYHFLAWKKLANELGFDFTDADNEKLKGVSRVESLRLILHWGGVEADAEEQLRLADKKNTWYLEYIAQMTAAEILPGVRHFLDDLKAKNIKIGLGTASKNAHKILDMIGLDHVFETIIDGNLATQSKPHPQVFLMGAASMGVSPKNTIVFEDAEKGIEAALAGGFRAVGVGQVAVLGKAHLVISSFDDVSIEEILSCLK